MQAVNMLMRGYANTHLQSCPHADTCTSALILASSVLIGGRAVWSLLSERLTGQSRGKGEEAGGL